MTLETAKYMLDSLLATQPDDETIGWQMMALITAIGFDEEKWLHIVGDDDESDDLFWSLHQDWPVTWTEMGDEFWLILDPMIASWKRVLGKAAA